VGKPLKTLLALAVPPLWADWIAERKSCWNCCGSTPLAWRSWAKADWAVDAELLVDAEASLELAESVVVEPEAEAVELLEAPDELLDEPVIFCWFFKTLAMASSMIVLGLVVDPLDWADCRAEVTADWIWLKNAPPSPP
jgi:hypothetical protein